MRNEELSVAAKAAFYDDTSSFAFIIGYGAEASPPPVADEGETQAGRNTSMPSASYGGLSPLSPTVTSPRTAGSHQAKAGDDVSDGSEPILHS